MPFVWSRLWRGAIKSVYACVCPLVCTHAHLVVIDRLKKRQGGKDRQAHRQISTMTTSSCNPLPSNSPSKLTCCLSSVRWGFLLSVMPAAEKNVRCYSDWFPTTCWHWHFDDNIWLLLHPAFCGHGLCEPMHRYGLFRCTFFLFLFSLFWRGGEGSSFNPLELFIFCELCISFNCAPFKPNSCFMSFVTFNQNSCINVESNSEKQTIYFSLANE